MRALGIRHPVELRIFDFSCPDRHSERISLVRTATESDKGRQFLRKCAILLIRVRVALIDCRMQSIRVRQQVLLSFAVEMVSETIKELAIVPE